MMRHNAIEAMEMIRTRAGDVAHHHSDNADLTPRIVREGVSGVISAQWSCSGHWMEVGLHSHNLTVHGYCLYYEQLAVIK